MADPLRIVFLGTAEFALPALRALAGGPHQLLAVITRPDRPAGRGRLPRPSPVKVAAQGFGLPVLQPKGVSRGEGLELLRRLSPDVLFVAAFGEVLSREALAVPRVGAVNLHASLLPKYRGAAPIQRALLAGEEETGVTVQWMAEAVDTGDIIIQRALAIGAQEDFGSLQERLAELGARASVEAMAMIAEGRAPRIPQPCEGVSYAPPVRREELVINWQDSAERISRQVRAFSPSPGARTSRAGKLLKVLVACHCAESGRKTDMGVEGKTGQVVEISKQGFWVNTGKGVVLALTVQPEARAVMSAADYVKGYRLSTGEQLGR